MKLIAAFTCVVMSSIFYADIPLDDGRVGRAEYVSSLIKPGDVGIEIGVYEGQFSYHVLLQNAPSKLYLVDPWQYGLQKDQEVDPTPEKQKIRDAQYEKVCDYFAPYENVEIIRMKSEDAFSMFSDEYFDYVYIDGEHSYDAVTRDLTNYFFKVKVGGYLIGDGYGWVGVASAVQDFLKVHQKDCLFLVDPFLGLSGGQFAVKRIK